MKIQSTPTDTVQAGFGALSDRNWLGLAASVHPAALTRFRQSELTFQLAWAYWKEGIAASKHRWAVAEDGSISPEGLGPVAHVTVSAYPDTPTVAQLATLSAPAFFATWCRAVYQSDSDRAQSNHKPDLRRQIVGEVLEGDNLAHVLYHLDFEAPEPWTIRVMPLKREGDRWFLLLNEDLASATASMMLLHA